MNLNNKLSLSLIILILSIVGFVSCSANRNPADDRIISYVADPCSQDLAFYWRDDSGKIIRSIQNLKTYAETKDKKLIFAMNGGMFDSLYTPQGLYIEDCLQLIPLDTASGSGNFYMKPNGVFYITTENKAAVCKTENFENGGQVKYATQSGPMLLTGGQIHPQFKEGSSNVHIRNGVGVLPDGKVLFAISVTKVNLYDFAAYFRSQGCTDALYLDGFVSRMYLPEKNRMQIDGKFGVIIAVTEDIKK
ncbi:uncharacterized protein YigE (DUF2233 family) [Dysgonomonas sp. PFB1-18]|uniref:phosphodiester glycosidase family protein n=1 Tax=unclassified Dysgonomonas TaxID=2630389 RepID=UPI002473797F|nr:MULTISPECIES: phosphodiester glycosidase family protein [unclassified Dysgonomonas]MDH6307635.1 uncharacterized protein YigE (DUF2233 family) [Dysgonomonas sp. PF1-14]MDH6337553.1 uncharacterized protein YigE (DUF2233 family) [Dysgonomonas sp. PF1-16]MDH6378777.1 uncharacterized protein YigE (DUF2233 family) [Dysgonomonas sp. PFB1-18]MDH6399195.1 uncharacterized protein YigE (DUF2233 family) [Dysgonomonas sp. PF1-23]